MRNGAGVAIAMTAKVEAAAVTAPTIATDAISRRRGRVVEDIRRSKCRGRHGCRGGQPQRNHQQEVAVLRADGQIEHTPGQDDGRRPSVRMNSA